MNYHGFTPVVSPPASDAAGRVRFHPLHPRTYVRGIRGLKIKVSYKILHHRLFEKEILRLPTHHQQKTYQILTALKENPRSLPSNTLSLSGYRDVYRTRIGDLRLVYQINHSKKIIFVLGISSRGNVYRLIRRMLN